MGCRRAAVPIALPTFLAPPLAALPASAAPSATGERIVHCTLTVGGRTYLDQPCLFDPLGKDGSFSIGTTGSGKGRPTPFFADVNKDEDGTARGFWNEDATSTHAQVPSGPLRRNGACWVDARAKVRAE